MTILEDLIAELTGLMDHEGGVACEDCRTKATLAIWHASTFDHISPMETVENGLQAREKRVEGAREELEGLIQEWKDRIPRGNA